MAEVHIDLSERVLREFDLDAALEAIMAQKTRNDFNHGICVALQVINSHGCSTAWDELVKAVGKAEIFYFAAHIHPEEWELGGFAKHGKKPRRAKG